MIKTYINNLTQILQSYKNFILLESHLTILLLQFLITYHNFYLYLILTSKTYYHNIFKRDLTNFKKEDFILDLLEIDWNTTLQTNNNDPDFSFSQFYEKINCKSDNHLPLKKVSKKELKQQFKTVDYNWYKKSEGYYKTKWLPT